MASNNMGSHCAVYRYKDRGYSIKLIADVGCLVRAASTFYHIPKLYDDSAQPY